MTLIRNQRIPKKQSFVDCERLGIMLVALNPVDIETNSGDCLEVDFNPEDCRRYVEQRSNFKVTVRQVEKGKWRVWKELR